MTLYNGAKLRLERPDGTLETEGLGHTFEVVKMGSVWDGKTSEQVIVIREIK